MKRGGFVPDGAPSAFAFLPALLLFLEPLVEPVLGSRQLLGPLSLVDRAAPGLRIGGLPLRLFRGPREIALGLPGFGVVVEHRSASVGCHSPASNAGLVPNGPGVARAATR